MPIDWRPLEQDRLLAGRLTAHPQRSFDPAAALADAIGFAVLQLAKAAPEDWQVLRIKARHDPPKADGTARGNRWHVEMILTRR